MKIKGLPSSENVTERRPWTTSNPEGLGERFERYGILTPLLMKLYEYISPSPKNPLAIDESKIFDRLDQDLDFLEPK